MVDDQKETIRFPEVYVIAKTKEMISNYANNKNNLKIGELYKSLALSDSANLSIIEKFNHYKIVEKLYLASSYFEKYLTSNRTFNSCYKGGDFEGFLGSIVLSMFTSFKENYMAKDKSTWEDWLKKIDAVDLHDLDIQRRVNIISAPNSVRNSDKKIISEIRNALDHTRYVFNDGILYIRNPEHSDHRIHAYDFEATIPFDFLVDFISLLPFKDRKQSSFIMETEDRRIYKYPNKFNFEDIKNKVHFYKGTSDKMSPLDSYTSNDIMDIFEGLKTLNKKEIDLTAKSEAIMRQYFNDKRHKIDYNNLQYTGLNLVRPPEELMWMLIIHVIRNVSKHNPITSGELIDNFCKEMPIVPGPRGESEQEARWLLLLGYKLRQKEYNGKNLIGNLPASKNYAHKYLTKECGFEYFIKHIEDNKVVTYYKKGDLIIRGLNVDNVCADLNSYYHSLKKIAENLPAWLKIQFVESAYVNGLIPLKNDTIPSLGGKPNVGKFTNREHIRNALVHNNYIMLHGVDDIVLRDGYDESNDSREWEETVSLSKLYDETYKEMVHNMKNESDLYIEQ